MLRKWAICGMLAMIATEATGCAGRDAIFRAQSPEAVRETDLDALCKWRQRAREGIHPAVEAAGKAARKALAGAGKLALLATAWWIDGGGLAELVCGGGGSSPKSGSAGPSARREEEDRDDRRLAEDRDDRAGPGA